MEDTIVQVSGFGVKNTYTTQCNYLLVGLTKSGKVVLSRGDGIWSDVSPNPDKNKEDKIQFLMDNMEPLLETYKKEYEENDMPLTYPTPDTYYITVKKIKKLLN